MPGSLRHPRLLTFLALLVALLPLARPVQAATTLHVTTPADTGGTCSGTSCPTLRAALTAANPGDTIRFDNGTSPWTITVQSPLPALTQGNLTIDGGPGPLVTISGAGGAFQNGNGLTITSAQNSITGLAITGFPFTIASSFSSGGNGIYLGAGATNNTISNCYLGVAIDGTTAAGNAIYGVLLDNGASNNTLQNNVIAGNTIANVGVSMETDTGTTPIQGNTLTNNRIGTRADGMAAISGNGDGVVLGKYAQNTTVGPGNLISGHTNSGSAANRVGIRLFSPSSLAVARPTNNVIIGNFIGTGPNGVGKIPNTNGIQVTVATGTLIGQAGAAVNLISGNLQAGVLVDDAQPSSTTIANNWIGLDANRDALGNGQQGVYLYRGVGTVVGPTNYIAGNDGDGVEVDSSSSTVTNNYLGVSPSATVPNGGVSLRLRDDGSSSTPAGNNTVTGNIVALGTGFNGIEIDSPSVTNTLQFNSVGVNADGVTRLTTTPPSDSTGILIKGSAGNVVTNNLVSAVGVGIALVGDGTENNQLSGNKIGTDTNGTGNLGNRRDGIRLSKASSDTQGPTGNLLTNNLVAFNGSDSTPFAQYNGVSIAGAHNNTLRGNMLVSNVSNGVSVNSATGIQISQTATHGNVLDGIALFNGGNGNRAAPTNLQVSGQTLTGTAPGCATCTIEVFTSLSPTDPPDNGEGPRYLTSGTADASGTFSIDVTGCNTYLTATATDAAHNTSPFTPQMVGGCQSPTAHIVLNPANPSQVIAPPSTTITYTHLLQNTGNAQANVTISAASNKGWSVSVNHTSVSLDPGTSTNIDVKVTVPADATAGEVSQTTVVASDGTESVNQVDTTVVQQAPIQPNFDFSPASQSPTDGLPGKTVTFTHTLTNNANGADSFTVLVTPTAGLTVAPIAPIMLPKGASTQVVVHAQIAPDLTAGQYTLDVSAQSNSAPYPFVNRQDIVNVLGVAVPAISPAPEQTANNSVITFTHTLTNTGNQAGSFTLTTSPPQGWSATPSNPACLTDLGPRGTCQFTMTVVLPPDPTGGPNNIIVTATTVGNSAANASVIDIVRVPVIPGVQLGPDRTGVADPGVPVTYTHTLTNTGNGTDSFTVTLQMTPGWSATSSPSIVTDVPRNSSRTITIVVTPPTGALAGSTGVVTTTATSATAPYPHASAVTTTTLNAKAGAELTPKEATLGVKPTNTAPDTATFVHTLRNSGSIPISYTLSASNSLPAWSSEISPTAVGPLQPGATTTISVSVTAPAGTPVNTENVTNVQVSQFGTGTILAAAQDTTIVGNVYGVLLTPAINQGNALPGTTRTYTHTLTNTGAANDSFLLSTVSFNGWKTAVAPSSVDLLAGQSRVITVSIQVPTSAFSSTLDVTTITAASTNSGSNTIATAQERTTISQVAEVSLSPQQSRIVTPLSTTILTHTLVNLGNGTDTFIITATGTLNWPMRIIPESQTLEAGASYTDITVQVQVPADIPAGSTDRITVIAKSKYDPAVTSQVEDVLSYPQIQTAISPGRPIFLPLVSTGVQ